MDSPGTGHDKFAMPAMRCICFVLDSIELNLPLRMLSICIDSNPATELSGRWLSGQGRPRDLADVTTEVMLAMDSQPGVPQQQAVLAGIASVTQLQHQQVNSY